MTEELGEEHAETQAGDTVINRIVYFVVEVYLFLYSQCVSYVVVTQR